MRRLLLKKGRVCIRMYITIYLGAVKPVNEETLFEVAVGLRVTYEEALMLFTFFGKNLLCDYPYMQKMNEELLQFDLLRNS